VEEETAGDNEARELAVLMSLTALDMPAGGTVAAAVGLGTVAATGRRGENTGGQKNKNKYTGRNSIGRKLKQKKRKRRGSSSEDEDDVEEGNECISTECASRNPKPGMTRIEVK
jgi:hypothetical protein